MAPYSTLLQNATTAILWQNVTEVYNKNVLDFLLQNVSLITNYHSALMLLVHKKNYQEIIKINVTKLFI